MPFYFFIRSFRSTRLISGEIDINIRLSEMKAKMCKGIILTMETILSSWIPAYGNVCNERQNWISFHDFSSLSSYFSIWRTQDDWCSVSTHLTWFSSEKFPYYHVPCKWVFQRCSNTLLISIHFDPIVICCNHHYILSNGDILRISHSHSLSL